MPVLSPKYKTVLIFVAAASLVGVSFYSSLCYIQLKERVTVLESRPNTIVQSAPQQASESISVGSASSLLNDFICTPLPSEKNTAAYLLKASVREHNVGDRIYFLVTADGKPSAKIDATSENDVVFTAKATVPPNLSWTLDLVIDRGGNLRSERLPQNESLDQLNMHSLPSPSYEGNISSTEGESTYRSNTSVSMPLQSYDPSAVGFVEFVERVAEIRLNGKIQKQVPMTIQDSTTPGPDGALQKEYRALMGTVTIPFHTGDVIETSVRVRTKTGQQYRYVLDQQRAKGSVLESQPTSASSWKAE